MRVKAATDAEAKAGRDKCVSRPGIYREVVGTLAAMREALAYVEAQMAAFERILKRKELVEAAVAGKGPTAGEYLVEASGL
jgi:hypothetical protein